MIFNPDAFWAFAAHVTVPTKEQGLIRITQPFGTQLRLGEEIARGLDEDIHDFVVLKGGRQIGGSTFADLLDIYWPPRNPGTAGQVVLDDDQNLNYRRFLIRQMWRSLPKRYRVPLGTDNAEIMEFKRVEMPNGRHVGGSQLIFGAAGMKSGEKLGRSKGLNYLHADEPGYWMLEKAVQSVRASLAETYALRLYLWIGTANGIGTPFHDMWKTALVSSSQRAVFLAWWMHRGYEIPVSNRRVWDMYGGDATQDERLWIRTVRRRYGHTISPEQLVWHRWKLAEAMNGDETMMAQEFSCLPEDAWQAFGHKLISPNAIQRIRVLLADAPRPKGYRYEWGRYLDHTTLHEDDPAHAALRVWEEPDPEGVYIVSAHPWGSSTPEATEWVVQVWRVWQDAMTQVAEYASEAGNGFQFAWAIAHLCGTYRKTDTPAYLIIEVGGAGMQVLKEVKDLEQNHYGLTNKFRGKQELRDVIGGVTHYVYSRPDTFGRKRMALEHKTHGENRLWLLTQARDEIEREIVEVRSERLVDELSMLRRGERGDNDQIGGGGSTSDARALCAALAIEHYRSTVWNDLPYLTAPKALKPWEQKQEAGQVLVGDFLNSVFRKGEAT